MCTREEINDLISELLYHVERVAVRGAEIQYEQEVQSTRNVNHSTCKDSGNKKCSAVRKKRLRQLVRFHSAYYKYLIFALDPYAEIIVPLTSSPLALFITNIISKTLPYQQYPQYMQHHTSRTIVEFLQVSGTFLAIVRSD